MRGLRLGLGLTPPKGGGYDPDAISLFNRSPVQPSSSVKRADSDLISALKSFGLWSKIDSFGLIRAPYSGAPKADRMVYSFLNIRQSRFDATAIDEPNLTVTDLYVQGNGTSSKVSLNFNPATATGTAWAQSTGIIGLFSLSAGPDSGIDMGNLNTLLAPRGATNVANHRISSNASGSVTGVSDASGWWFTNRTGTADADNRLYRDAVVQPVNSNPVSNQTPNNADLHLCGRGGSSPSFSARPIGGWLIGGGFSAQDIANFVTVVS